MTDSTDTLAPIRDPLWPGPGPYPLYSAVAAIGEERRSVFLGATIEAMALLTKVRLKPGGRVLILGVSPVTLIMTQLLRGRGTPDIQSVDSDHERREVFENLHCCPTYDLASLSWCAEILKCGKLDLVVDMLGDPSVIAAAMDLCEYRAWVVLATSFGGRTVDLNLYATVHRMGLRVAGFRRIFLEGSEQERRGAIKAFKAEAIQLLSQDLPLWGSLSLFCVGTRDGPSSASV